jgi:hypothetical protein
MVGSGGPSGSLESGGRFFVCVWQSPKSCFHINLLKRKLYILCSFIEIYKDNAVINCITVQHKTCIPVKCEWMY